MISWLYYKIKSNNLQEVDNQEENVQQARQALICDEITKKSIVPLSGERPTTRVICLLHF